MYYSAEEGGSEEVLFTPGLQLTCPSLTIHPGTNTITVKGKVCVSMYSVYLMPLHSPPSPFLSFSTIQLLSSPPSPSIFYIIVILLPPLSSLPLSPSPLPLSPSLPPPLLPLPLPPPQLSTPGAYFPYHIILKSGALDFCLVVPRNKSKSCPLTVLHESVDITIALIPQFKGHNIIIGFTVYMYMYM